MKVSGITLERTHPVKAQGVRIVHRGQAASAARFCGRQFQGSRSAIRLAG